VDGVENPAVRAQKPASSIGATTTQRSPPVRPGFAGMWAPQHIDFASWLESLWRLGWFVIRISRPRLKVLMLGNPLNRVIFRNKALDYFRFAIGP
jgi:hypothetical protein